ncbi:MAG: ATP-binding cassette domain-containing protein, partial [Firmicutes bacterium]|nr:ATP-binding cassette domain-containing protein [Bacillota bacterium]
MALLEVRDLSIQFGGLKALDGFTLSLDEGEMVGLIGPNGAGKTTVFNLITGVYRPSRGEIRFRGRSLVGLRPNPLVRLGIARTFQNIRLFKGLSVVDNVRAALFSQTGYGLLPALVGGGRTAGEEARVYWRAMEMLRLFELEEVAAEPAGSLPYGAQRRLEMAR